MSLEIHSRYRQQQQQQQQPKPLEQRNVGGFLLIILTVIVYTHINDLQF